MKLFGYWRSSASYRVRIVLALKDLPYAYEAVNLLKGEHRTPAHLARNPQALVPALETDEGEVLTQSLAIIEYLEDRYPERPILPNNLEERAKARAIAATLACEAQPFMNLRMQNYLKDERGFDAGAMSDWLGRWTGGAMAAAEKLVASSSGKYCIGDRPTIADAFLVPQFYGAKRFGIDVSGLERLNEIYERCVRQPAFEKAHPDNQPDAVRT